VDEVRFDFGDIGPAPARPELLDATLDLVAPILERSSRTARTILGIAGPPAAGKSTLATALTEAIQADLGAGGAVTVPMDGFHLSNVELERLGLTDRKGAVQTFDAQGFVHLIERVARGDELVYAPAYSRVLHESIGGVIPIFPHTRVVVVEGNYLLLPEEPWIRARPLFDLTIYVDAPDEIRLGRLWHRQRSRGLDPDQAEDWVQRSDEANARLIATTRAFSDAVLTRSDAFPHPS
jgi:pantothenate kinase